MDHFGQGRHLLLLDNCEHLAWSCAKLAVELLARCPRLQVLGTSRSALMLSEERVCIRSRRCQSLRKGLDLAGIQANESVKLFRERAGAKFQINESNADTVAALCRTLDGIPLAIEVAAARLGVLSVAQMNMESRNLMNMLAGVKVDDLRNWHTVNAALEWSYRLLTKPSCEFLRSLAVFDGGWTDERATALYAESPQEGKKHSGSAAEALGQFHGGIARSERRPTVSLVGTGAAISQGQANREGDSRSTETNTRRSLRHLAEESSSQLLKVDQSKWLDTLQSEC